ncbi:STAS domain-containing protein [Leptospira sp. WS58.C1]|uniref:STAS domain-containing protein n=1 Tax=Leptospira TaxID=171 RepID=UPI0002BE95FF|nr:MULTISPECIES: STAS domain-containing protein [unclassified Leptospira]EMK01871.1 STAS domain protein [Leptospira sp. B5-022]MCR1793883.1 STAS domain-containing protein [Leptospira sp. id769339]
MELTVEIKGNSRVIHLIGNMDVHNTHKVEQAFMDHIRKATESNIVLDMSNVEFVSSAGLRVIVGSLRVCKEREIQLKLAALRPAVRKVFEIIDMDSLFRIYDTVDSSLQ